MSQDNIIGYDIRPNFCQISYLNNELNEPENLEDGHDSFHIPMLMNYYKGSWVYGKNARRMGDVRGSFLIDDIWEKALQNERLDLDGEEFDAVWILAEFIRLSLQEFESIKSLTFTVPEISPEIRQLLKGIGQRILSNKDAVYVQDYKESFCHYMFNQPKELWQYESALFYFHDDIISACTLRELTIGCQSEHESFVTVDKALDLKLEELKHVYPVLNVDEAKVADEQFKKFIQEVFEKKRVSSVFLTGEGFDNNWYPNSLRVLCNGRRAFLGSNLYSKGACYTALRRLSESNDAPVYLDETKMTEQISIKMRVNGNEMWYPLVAWGSHWYESDHQCEVLLENSQDIEIHIESLVTGTVRTEVISLKGLPERKNYATRLRIETIFADECHCKVIFEDVGFGEFFPATDYRVEKIIELGGSNGQFNSLS